MSIPTAALKADAKNRALRTLLVNLATDTGVALVLVMVNAFSDANGWGDFDWNILLFTLAKTAIVTAGSFILRRFLDPSGLPTPLPPANPGPPADPADVGESAAVFVLAVVGVVLIVLLLVGVLGR